MGCLPAKSCKKMIEMLEKSWKSLVNAGNKSHHITISPSHNLCNFREIVDNGVGAGFHETLSQTVAVRNADGHTVGVATHENVEVGVAYDDGVLEYLAICGCTLRSLLLVHRLEHGERLHEGRPIVAAISSSLCCGRCMASKVRWKVLSITGFVSAMVPSKSRITIFFILLVFYSYVLLFIVLHYLFIFCKDTKK